MRINFLSASNGTPLSKTFQETAPGTYKETSYPFVAKFNSIERDITSPYEFFTHIRACAEEGLCLLKGELDRPLLNESRAGHTNTSTPTQWLCLDVDYLVTGHTPRTWLEELSTEFKDVSFIFQHSASSGIKHETDGWRGHFFILLDSAQPPQALKQWLIQLNLGSVSLQANIGLSASGGALIYPLDITTCQNDKLLYITPPNCVGFADPIQQRFELFEGTQDTAHLDLSAVSAAANQQAVNQLIAAKRKDAKLEKKVFKLVQKYDYEVMVNPDPVTVTGKKEARDFVYLNLNGGDSWAYYFPIDNPEILHNFKGEPCMYMQHVDKEIYNEYRNKPSADVPGSIPFGFLWPNDDTYYRGFASQETGRLDWIYAVGSKGKLKDFLVQNGADPGKGWVVPEWQMVFDPSVEGRVDFTGQTINTYKRTPYMINAVQGNSIPPIIDRLLISVCVDEPTKQHFLNWLAAIFQTRQKTSTAWIFQGVQGTGKGVLFSRVLSPLLGPEYCHEMTMDRLDDDFNSYLAENILLFIDEAKITDSKDGVRLLNRIKNLVTEPEQHIRGMRRNAVTRRNFSNIILASNYDEIIPMEASDRRFNVAPRQEKSIRLDYDHIVEIADELPLFSNYLHSYAFDNKQVKKVILSEARSQLITLSETTVTSFFHAVSTGKLSYFVQYLDNNVKSDLEGIRYHDYALIVKRWINCVGQETVVTRNELRSCYQFLQNASISATKFTRMCSKYGLHMKSVRADTGVTQGLQGIIWQLTPEEVEQQQEKPRTNVIAIKERI